GNIRTPRLSVADGAILDGQLTMSGAGSFEGSDVLLTLKDVAQYLKVESRVIEEWAESHKIPARFENGNWVFSKSEVDQCIQQEKVRV
ncbi:MAG TPA: helix-turn-helix domain-containing protein, partial [Candidatus Omnitrophota bacterium]|nr:helix-turn-helix domain-containing protein [Candidatus Omnitrophota bacterium]